MVDDLSTGSIENLDSLRKHPDFGHTLADVRDEPILAELVDRAMWSITWPRPWACA